jgi:hypothetical protein
MRKSKQAAVALAAGSLFATGVGASYAASAASKPHVLTFKVKSTSQKNFGKRFVSTDKDLSHGKHIGNDVLTGSYNPKTKTVSGDVAVGLAGGIIYAHLNFPAKGKTFTGTVTGGAGKYKGASGSVTGTSLGHGKQKVTVTYH